MRAPRLPSYLSRLGDYAPGIDLPGIARDLRLTFFSHFFLKFVGYIVLLIITRHFDKGEAGEFFFVLSLATLFALGTELGTGNHLVRAVACEPEGAVAEFSRLLSLRLALAVPYLLSLNALVAITRPDTALTCALVSVYVLLDQLYGSFASLFLALGHADYTVGVRVFSGLLLVSTIFAAASLGWSMPVVLSFYVLSSLVMVANGLWLVSTRIGRVRLRWEPAELMKLGLGSLPFFAATALTMVHTNIDSVSLGILQPYAVVAAYAVGLKLLEVLRYATRPLVSVLYPACARLVRGGDWPAIAALLKRLLLLALAAGVLISAGAVLLADVAVGMVLGKNYGDAAGLVKVLFLSVGPLYVGTLSIMFANSLHVERRIASVMMWAVGFNVVLSVVGVITGGAVGAAWATVLSECVIAGAVTREVLYELRARAGARYGEERFGAAVEDSDGSGLPLPLA